MVNIRRGWTIPARPEEADREERRQRRLLDTELTRWRERAPQPSPKPEEEGPIQLGPSEPRTQGLFGLRAPTVGPAPAPEPTPTEPPPRELAEAFAPPPSGAFQEAPLSAFGQLEEERVQRGARGAREFAETIQGRDLREVALLMGLAEVARQRGVTPQQLLAEPGETDFELTNLQREVQLASRPFLEQLEPSGDPLAVGKRFGLGALQLAQEAEALERRTLAPVTRPVGRAVTQAVSEAVVPQVPRPLRALGVPEFPGREAFREQAGEVGETVGEFGLVPSNLIPIPIADDILRILAKGVPLAARLLTRTGRTATRAELGELAAGARRFLTRTPPTAPAERRVVEEAVETLSREAAEEGGSFEARLAAQEAESSARKARIEAGVGPVRESPTEAQRGTSVFFEAEAERLLKEERDAAFRAGHSVGKRAWRESSLGEAYARMRDDIRGDYIKARTGEGMSTTFTPEQQVIFHSQGEQHRRAGRAPARAAGEVGEGAIPAEPGNIIDRLFTAFELADKNARLANRFIVEQVDPAFRNRFGDAPVMSIKRRVGQEPLLSIHTAGWRERAEQIGLEFVDDKGFSTQWRMPDRGPQLPSPAPTRAAGEPTVRQVDLEGREIDTFATEREFGGVRERQAGLPMGAGELPTETAGPLFRPVPSLADDALRDIAEERSLAQAILRDPTSRRQAGALAETRTRLAALDREEAIVRDWQQRGLSPEAQAAELRELEQAAAVQMGRADIRRPGAMTVRGPAFGTAEAAEAELARRGRRPAGQRRAIEGRPFGAEELAAEGAALDAVGARLGLGVGPPRLETLADDAARLADEGLPSVGGGAVIGLPSPRTLKTVEEIAQDARRSTQNAFGALTRGAARFGPTRTLADFINPSALIDAPPANLVNEIGEEAASQLQSNLVAHARQMDQGSAIAAAIEEGVQTRARAVGLDVQDGLVVSVRGAPPVGDLFENPSRYALTREQRQLVDEVQTVLNDMNAVEKAAGVKKGQLFSGEGRYFPRLVREVRGVENQRAQVRRIVGGRQGFTRERFYETMQEGMDAGVRYEDDIGAIVGTRIRAGMKATGDESLAQLIRPLGRTLKVPRTTVGIGETGTMVPALGGRAFPTETGRAIMDALSPAPPGSTLRFTDALNNVLRPIQATGELSFWGIQMLGSIFRNPAAFAKGAVMSLDGLLLDGRMYGRYIQNNSDWINRFVRGNGVWNSSEFTFDQAVRNKTIRDVFTRTGIKGALGRFDQAFNQGLNVTALENFKGMVGLGDSVGFDKFNRTIRAALGDFAGETTDEVAASVASKMTGRLPVRGLGVKATQRSVESALAFAPRYYRAMFGLLGDAIQGGMRGAEAKRVLGSLFAGALATHVAVAHGLGQEPNLDPRNSNFLTVRVGKTKMGVGGPIYGLGRMIAESVENPDKLRSVNMDNPLVRWARGRAAPVLSLATDLVTQETFMGEKIDSVGDLFREIATTPLPFIAQQTIEEGPEGFAPQFFGLRAFPAGTRERFEDLYQEKYGTAPQPDISPRQLDPELAAQAGYDPARETEFGAERAGITAGEEGRLADLSRIVLTGQPEAMEQFEEELGDFFRFRSGVTETLVRDLGLPEREASLVQDFYDLDPRDLRDPETGKPDWDRFEAKRERVLSQLRREGPSGREAASALERGTGISFPDPDLQRVYDARQSLREGLDAYYDTDSKKREAYRRRNPEVDAKLYLLGRVSRVVTSAAQREVRSLSRSLLGTEVEAGRGERRQRRFGEPIRIGPIEPIAIGR